MNINLVTNEKADRLVFPSTAVLRQGSRSVVLIVEDGRVVEKPVLTRPAVEVGIPIARGGVETDQVIVNPAGVTVGQTVRGKRRGE